MILFNHGLNLFLLSFSQLFIATDFYSQKIVLLFHMIDFSFKLMILMPEFLVFMLWFIFFLFNFFDLFLNLFKIVFDEKFIGILCGHTYKKIALLDNGRVFTNVMKDWLVAFFPLSLVLLFKDFLFQVVILLVQGFDPFFVDFKLVYEIFVGELLNLGWCVDEVLA